MSILPMKQSICERPIMKRGFDSLHPLFSYFATSMGELATPPSEVVDLQRRAVAERFLTGQGLEVGAGDRPFPVRRRVQVFYGDIRDMASIQGYFKTSEVRSGSPIDAQTFAGIA